MQRLITANKAPSRIHLAHKSTDTTLRCITTHIIVAEIVRQVSYSNFSIHCLPNVDLQVVIMSILIYFSLKHKTQNSNIRNNHDLCVILKTFNFILHVLTCFY